MTKEHIKTLAGFARLIECEMATYERLSTIKRTPASELARHESIIKEAIVPHWIDFSYGAPEPSQGRAKYGCPRLHEVLVNMNSEGAEAGINMYFNKTRSYRT